MRRGAGGGEGGGEEGGGAALVPFFRPPPRPFSPSPHHDHDQADDASVLVVEGVEEQHAQWGGGRAAGSRHEAVCVGGRGGHSLTVGKSVNQHDAMQRGGGGVAGSRHEAALFRGGAGVRLHYPRDSLTVTGAHSHYDGRQHRLQPLPGWLKCGAHSLYDGGKHRLQPLPGLGRGQQRMRRIHA